MLFIDYVAYQLHTAQRATKNKTVFSFVSRGDRHASAWRWWGIINEYSKFIVVIQPYPVGYLNDTCGENQHDGEIL